MNDMHPADVEHAVALFRRVILGEDDEALALAATLRSDLLDTCERAAIRLGNVVTGTLMNRPMDSPLHNSR